MIDVDGHVLEFMPAVLPYLREALGADAFERYQQGVADRPILSADPASRIATGTPQTAWWGTPSEPARDLATAVFPQLLHDRMDELGIDYSVLYATKGFGIAGIKDDEIRRGVCRGFNDFYAEEYRAFADRFTVAGVIPMHTPEEAIAELEHCKASA